MNSFDGITLSGANKTRYVPIFGNSAGIIGAYRKTMGLKTVAHVKHYGTIELGLVPLFLLDGELSVQLLTKAVKTINQMAYVAIYRPFDLKLKKRLEETYRKCRGGGFINGDGSIAEWALEDKRKAETKNDEFTDLRLGAVQPYLDYEMAREAYSAAVSVYPVDLRTGQKITGDINTFLYERAREMFPLGVESILAGNIRQSAIPKHQFFVDGLQGAPAPKGVKQKGRGDSQIALFEADRTSIDDTLEELRGFYRQSINQNGVVKLIDIITHCAEIGLYKGSITLYAIGASLRSFLTENAIFYDGVCYYRYTEVRDISSWILREYDKYETHNAQKLSRPAIFFDNTALKGRIESIFGIELSPKKLFDTLGMAIVMAGAWIAENLRYPIAFLDDFLRRLIKEHCLYGKTLQEYDAYFTEARCNWLKDRIPYADSIARQIIKETVGFDPDMVRHGMSNLPKNHYASVYYSTDEYITEMLKERP